MRDTHEVSEESPAIHEQRRVFSEREVVPAFYRCSGVFRLSWMGMRDMKVDAKKLSCRRGTRAHTPQTTRTGAIEHRRRPPTVPGPAQQRTSAEHRRSVRTATHAQMGAIALTMHLEIGSRDEERVPV